MLASTPGGPDYTATGANALVEITHGGLTLIPVAREAPRSVAISVRLEHTAHIMSAVRYGNDLVLRCRVLLAMPLRFVDEIGCKNGVEVLIKGGRARSRTGPISLQVGSRFWL